MEMRMFQIKTFKQKLPVLFTVKNKNLESVSFFEEVYLLKKRQINLEEFEQRVKTKLNILSHE